MVTLAVTRDQAKHVGLWFFLATITMLFAAMTSAMIIRRASSDWQPLYFPHLLWLNTTLLLFSSITLECSRKALKQLDLFQHQLWLRITTVLGFAFLVGQIVAWKILALHGVFLPTNPHSSFFYLLTALHGLHLLGGVIWLSLANKKSSLTLITTYWHFLAFLWIYLFVLLFIL